MPQWAKTADFSTSPQSTPLEPAGRSVIHTSHHFINEQSITRTTTTHNSTWKTNQFEQVEIFTKSVFTNQFEQVEIFTKSVSWFRWSKTKLLKIEIFTNASILILCLYVCLYCYVHVSLSSLLCLYPSITTQRPEPNILWDQLSTKF